MVRLLLTLRIANSGPLRPTADPMYPANLLVDIFENEFQKCPTSSSVNIALEKADRVQKLAAVSKS